MDNRIALSADFIGKILRKLPERADDSFSPALQQLRIGEDEISLPVKSHVKLVPNFTITLHSFVIENGIVWIKVGGVKGAAITAVVRLLKVLFGENLKMKTAEGRIGIDPSLHAGKYFSGDEPVRLSSIKVDHGIELIFE